MPRMLIGLSDIVIDNSYWEDNVDIYKESWYRLGADSLVKEHGLNHIMTR